MKSKKIAAFIFLILICTSSIVQASDDVKTLPPSMYSQMKKGHKLEKIWIGNDYDKTKGFKVTTVDYKAEDRNGIVIDYMPKALATLAQTNSTFTLHLTITKVTGKTFTGFGYLPGKVIVEGEIIDAAGKIIAAFTDKESAGSFGTPEDYPSACDKIASGIAKDLL